MYLFQGSSSIENLNFISEKDFLMNTSSRLDCERDSALIKNRHNCDDIEIVSSSSHVTRVLEGQDEVTPRVTTG